MKNSFDFRRFGQVLVKDWKSYFRNFGVSLIVWCCLPILLWMMTLVLDFTMCNDRRFIFIGIFVFTAMMFIPSKVYGHANHSREGVSFAMLPATNVEKFFSMLFYCSIFTPLIVGLGNWFVDTLLALLPFGGFEGFVTLPSKLTMTFIMLIVCTCFMLTSIFMYGNMMFKKRKVGKTVAWGLLIALVLTLILELFHFWKHFFTWAARISNQELFMWINAAIMLVIAILFFILTFRKIKKQTY